MSCLGYIKKMNSEMLKKLKINGRECFFYDEQIEYFEVCGVCVTSSDSIATLYDFWGKVELMKKKDTSIPQTGSVSLRIKPKIVKNRIVFVCTKVKAVTIYEELVFNLETKALCHHDFNTN